MVAAYDVPPPPPNDDIQTQEWLFEIYKRNQTLLDSVSTLGALDGVVLTGPLEVGDGIQWNGSAWVDVQMPQFFGTPLDNQVAIWRSNSTLEGDANLTWDGSLLTVEGELRVNDTLLLGTGTQNFLIRHGGTTGLAAGLITLSGGSGFADGANIQIFGEFHATNRNDMEFRKGTNSWMSWDESEGSLELQTGTGSKLRSLILVSNRDATFTRQLTVGAGVISQQGIHVNASATGNPYIQFDQAGTQKAFIQYVDTGDQLEIDSDGDIEFHPFNILALTLTTGGAATFVGAVTVTTLDANVEYLFTEQADHDFTPVDTRAILWTRDDTPNAPIFTDDTAIDHNLVVRDLHQSGGTLAETSGNAHASIAGAPAGTVVPGVATQNWEVDVTIDGGSLQQLAIAVNILDDYDTIAATLSTAITGGTCAFVSGDFVVTSGTTGSTSTVVVAAGTLGVTSDLFAAITAAAAGNPAITFPTPTAGTDVSTIDPDAGHSFEFTLGVAATAEIGFAASDTAVAEVTLEVTNGGQGTLTWGVEVEWVGGAAPTLTAAGTDLLKFYTRDSGTTWIGWVVALDVS